jgi:hypothetical protein
MNDEGWAKEEFKKKKHMKEEITRHASKKNFVAAAPGWHQQPDWDRRKQHMNTQSTTSKTIRPINDERQDEVEGKQQ